jgi:precorrin-6B methylase 2
MPRPKFAVLADDGEVVADAATLEALAEELERADPHGRSGLSVVEYKRSGYNTLAKGDTAEGLRRKALDKTGRV